MLQTDVAHLVRKYRGDPVPDLIWRALDDEKVPLAIRNVLRLPANGLSRFDKTRPDKDTWQSLSDALNRLNFVLPFIERELEAEPDAKPLPIRALWDRNAEHYQSAQAQIRAAIDVLEDLIAFGRQEQLNNPKRLRDGSRIRRWTLLTRCQRCWRFAPAGGRLAPLCSTHHVPPPPPPRASRTKMDRYKEAKREYEEARLDLTYPLEPGGLANEAYPFMVGQVAAEVPKGYLAEEDELHDFMAVLNGNLAACNYGNPCPPDLAALLQTLPALSRWLADRAPAEGQVLKDNDTAGILSLVDPIGADPFGIHRAARESQVQNTRLAAFQLMDAEAWRRTRELRSSRHGGRRR